MKYIIWPKEKNIICCESGIANSVNISHIRRKVVFSELMIVMEGTLHIKHIEEYFLQKGDVFFLPQNIEHYGTKPSSFIIQWFHFILPAEHQIVDESFITPNIINTHIVLPMQLKISNINNLTTLGYQLEQYHNTPATQSIRDSLISAIIYDIALQATDRHLGVLLTHKRLNSITNYINSHVSLPLSIKEISNQFGYNEKYIFNLFKKYLNISPLQYIIQQKMNIAKNMLLSTNNTIEAIAISLSYDNPQYFMRLFKKTFGYTPSEFRKSFSNSLELYLIEENNT